MEARALFERGGELQLVDRNDQAVAVYDELLARFGDSADPEVRGLVAEAMLRRAVCLKPPARLRAFDELLARFDGAPEPGARAAVAYALLNKATALSKLDRGDEALAVWGEIIERYSDSDQYEMQDVVSQAALAKAHELNSAEAIPLYRLVVDRYSSADENRVAERALGAPLDLAWLLMRLKRDEEALAVYDEAAARGDLQVPEHRSVYGAQARLRKSWRLAELGRTEEAMALQDEIVARYDGAFHPQVQCVVAEALLDKGALLARQGRDEEAAAAYQQVIERYAGNRAPAVIEMVRRARRAL